MSKIELDPGFFKALRIPMPQLRGLKLENRRAVGCDVSFPPNTYAPIAGIETTNLWMTIYPKIASEYLCPNCGD